MRYADQKIYRTFEEFEREELRRGDGIGSMVDAMVDDMLGESLAEDLDPGASRSRRSAPEDDED